MRLGVRHDEQADAMREAAGARRVIQNPARWLANPPRAATPLRAKDCRRNRHEPSPTPQSAALVVVDQSHREPVQSGMRRFAPGQTLERRRHGAALDRSRHTGGQMQISPGYGLYGDAQLVVALRTTGASIKRTEKKLEAAGSAA
jgi:hypothetical protein